MSRKTDNIPRGWAHVLPTEAQWEYARVQGRALPRLLVGGFDNCGSDANWNHGNDANQTEDVGQYLPNPWGFFDMHGNVWEWTADAWGTCIGSKTDPFNAPATEQVGPGEVRGLLMVRIYLWLVGLVTFQQIDLITWVFAHLFRQIPNNPPTDLNSTANLTISENQPVGTIVGEFNATDSDGDSITYHLVGKGKQ